MAESLSLDLVLKIVGGLKNTHDLGESVDALEKDYTQRFRQGDGVNQAESLFRDTRQLGASAEEDIDLVGVLSTAFGTVISANKVKAIAVVAHPTNVNEVHVSQHPASGVPFALAGGDGVRVAPGGTFLLTNPTAAGFAVTASTDRIRVQNGGAGSAVDYDIVIVASLS